jgi:hypothetical protein
MPMKYLSKKYPFDIGYAPNQNFSCWLKFGISQSLRFSNIPSNIRIIDYPVEKNNFTVIEGIRWGELNSVKFGWKINGSLCISSPLNILLFAFILFITDLSFKIGESILFSIHFRSYKLLQKDVFI